MQLLHPGFLWLLLLAAVPVALYLFRRKSKLVAVSTLVFFKTLAREHQESAWLRRLKKLLSLLLTLFLLLGAVLALARPILSPLSTEGYRTVVILLDRSASMGAEDPAGRARLEEAKEQIRARLDRVPEDTGVALIAYDARPEVLQPRTLKRRELLSRLDEVAIRPVAGRGRVAMDSAVVLARLETPAIIWHVTDSGLDARERKAPGEEPPDAAAPDGEGSEAEGGGVDPAGEEEEAGEEEAAALPALAFELPPGVEAETISVALESPVNAGITAFQIRPAPLEHGRFEAFIQVSLNAAAPGPLPAKLDVFLGGLLVQARELDLEPGGSEALVIKMEGAEDQMLRVRLSVEGDGLSIDDEVLEPLPRVRPIVAAWVRPADPADPFRPDRFTEFALRAFLDDYDFEILSLAPEAWPGARASVDVAIFDDCVPEEWPEELPVILINPPGDAGPIRARRIEGGLPHESVRAGNEDHPVLFRVSSGRVAVTQTAVFAMAGSLEPLWLAGDEPVLAAGDFRGQRLVVMGFSPGRSERLPLTASFPLLLGNALLWSAETAPGITERLTQAPAGRVVPVEGSEVTWTRWEEGGLRRSTSRIAGGVLDLDRLGVWETDTGQRGAVHLLSRSETDLPARPAADSGEAGDFPTARAGWLSGEAAWLLMALLAFILLAESYLFHRHAVY